MEELNFIQVEVAYAKPDEQVILSLQVLAGTPAQQAIETSQILTLFPEIDLNRNKIGIFSKICPLTMPLRDGDRVEIYRPLLTNPKQLRKQKALQEKLT